MWLGTYRYVVGDELDIRPSKAEYIEKKYRLKGKCKVTGHLKPTEEADHAFVIKDEFGNVDYVDKEDMDLCFQKKNDTLHHTDEYKQEKFYYVGNILTPDDNVDAEKALDGFKEVAILWDEIPQEMKVIEKFFESDKKLPTFTMEAKVRMQIPCEFIHTFYKKQKDM